MDREFTRRALVGAILAGGVAGSTFTPVRGYLERFAPLSGSAWGATEQTDRTVKFDEAVPDSIIDSLCCR